MIKLLVIDDEIWIRERIAREIPWDSVGAEVIGAAQDGMEALEQIEQTQPDVIITDIRMPGLDGIELLKELKSRSIDSKIIILSGYNDFSYAKDALRYGAFDYVLKPVEDEELLEIVNKCIVALKMEREKERYIRSLEKKAELGYQAIKEKMLLDIISGDYQDGKNNVDEEYASAWNTFQDAMAKSSHRCILVALNYPSEDPERRELEHFIIKNVMTEILEKYGIVNKAYFHSRVEWLFVLSCGHLEDIVQRLFQDLDIVREMAVQRLGLDIAIGVGESCDDFFNIAYSYQTVRSLMRYRKWIGSNHIIYHSANIVTQIKAIGHYSTARLALCLKEGNFSEAEKELTDIYKKAKRNVPQTQLSAVCRMIWVDVEKEFYQYFKTYTGEGNANYFRIEFWNTVDDIENEEQFLELLHRFQQENAKNVNKGKKIALKARDYIVQNYNRPISLNNVADYLELNPSYLCRVFKEEMNVSFVTFLQNYRMDKAEDLLTNTDYKIYEISEKVGYENQQYFNKVFRNVKGVSPSAVRENRSKK